MAPSLSRLRAFTLIKWYALWVASGILALGVWRETGWWRWSAPFFALAALLGLSSALHLPAIEWAMGPLSVAWLMSWARALRGAAAEGYVAGVRPRQAT